MEGSQNGTEEMIHFGFELCFAFESCSGSRAYRWLFRKVIFLRYVGLQDS